MKELTADMPETKKKKRVGSIIFRIILIVIAGLTVGIGVFSWNASGLVGNQLPMPFGIGASVVMSSSMEPVLHINDFVIVKEQDSYETDDVVVFQEGNMLVIHRIISIDGEKVITKGDANNTADNPIEVSKIKGKMAFRIPFIGVIFKYVKTVPGTLLVLALAIYLLYRSRQKERTADAEELDSIVQEIERLKALRDASVDKAVDQSETPAVTDDSAESGSTMEKSTDDGPALDDAVIASSNNDKSTDNDESIIKEEITD